MGADHMVEFRVWSKLMVGMATTFRLAGGAARAGPLRHVVPLKIWVMRTHMT